MEAFLQDYELTMRLGVFFGVLLLVALWEILAPRRRLAASKPVRWVSNLGMVAIDSLLMRFVFPIFAIGMAFLAAERGFGLFNVVTLPGWLTVAISVIVLDFVIYLQHRTFHFVPFLWRLHMVHHSDLDIDVSTGARFHPIEIMISMGIKIGAVAALGAPALGVLIFELLLSGTTMFNHGNIRLPLWLDRILRLIIVTPDMHRVHHSIAPVETNSNFGFNLSWWDRLFTTYRAQPATGHVEMGIGLDQFPDAGRLTLPWLLLLPFTGKTGNYPARRYLT